MDGPSPDRTHDGDVIEHRSIRARRGRGRARISLSLTSMIDVTFLLLIYFMVATEFKLNEEVYKLDLPQRLQSTAERDPFDLDEQPLVIEVASTGVARNAYRLFVDWRDRQPSTFGELKEMLQSKRIGASGGSLYMPDHPVVIKPAPTATWEHTVGAFNAVVLAEYSNVRFGEPE